MGALKFDLTSCECHRSLELKIKRIYIDLEHIREGQKLLREFEYTFYDLSPVKPNIHYRLKSEACDQMEKLMRLKRKDRMWCVKKYKDSVFFGMDLTSVNLTIEEC